MGPRTIITAHTGAAASCATRSSRSSAQKPQHGSFVAARGSSATFFQGRKRKGAAIALSTRESTRRSIRMTHGKVRPAPVSRSNRVVTCNASFKTTEQHQIASPVKCTVCDRSFRTTENLVQHTNDSHRPGPAPSSNRVVVASMKCNVMKCNMCNRSFRTRDHLLQHKNDSHRPAPVSSSKKVVACHECGEKFSDVAHLNDHRMSKPSHTKLSAPNRNCCVECGKQLDHSLHLEQHFAADHTVSRLHGADRESVSLLFTQQWKHSPKAPMVLDILRVYNPGHRVFKFEEHRRKLKEEENKRRQKNVEIMTNGNELVRFHGTKVRCNLGTKGQMKMCSDTSCNLCCILGSGFKKSKARKDAFQRFGPGIYITDTSSKADAYVRAEDIEGRKVMILCKVLAGRVHELQENRVTLVEPPPGCHSVRGVPGRVLNYDELVVYSNSAILPQSIIVYQ